MFTNVWNLLLTARFRLLALAVLAHSLNGQTPEAIQVIDVSPQADRASAANAVEVYNRGNIIRMVGASEADVIRVFGSKLGTFKVLEKSGRTALRDGGSEALKLQGVAGYRDAHGVVHTVQSYAPENSPNAKINTKWREHLEDWIERESAKAASTKVDDPTPPGEAWTTLYTTTVQATSSYGNFEQSAIKVYRLNDTNPTSDYYMVYTSPEVTPYFDTCDGLTYCGWHTMTRSFQIKATETVVLADHGPTGTISTESGGFNIGGSLGPQGPGGSATFSTSWSQPDVTTVDGSTNTYGRWDETFNQGTFSLTCNPAFGRVTPVSKGTFLTRQGAIFQVAGGTTKFNTSIETEAQFCGYEIGDTSTFNYDGFTIHTSLPLGPPSLYVTPKSLTIPAGQSATLLVTSFVPGSSQGFVWNVSTNHATSWLSVPSNGPFSTDRAIQVSVAPNTPEGSTGTVSVNSSPPFAAPSVETGPIEVKVTVGTPETQKSAGVLLMGGYNPSHSIATTPEVFDVATQQIIPTTGLPIFAPSDHTATLLSNGDILIAGGAVRLLPNQSIVTNAAQLFRPSTRTFSSTGSMNTARRRHTATLLPDGKVLVTGGGDSDGGFLASAELYNPVTGTFTPAGSMRTPRSSHTASLISDPGQPVQVVVYGSGGSATAQTWEMWSEANGNFTAQGNMATGQTTFPQPLPLGNGRLVLAGGQDSDGNSIVTEQLLGPNGPSFLVGQSMKAPRSSHTLTALPATGELVAIGGYHLVQKPFSNTTLGSVDVRDATGWNLLSGTNQCPGSKGCLLTPRSQHTATLLTDGTILVAGGNDANGTALGNTEVYNPTTKSFTYGPTFSPRGGHTATPFVNSTTTLNVSPNPSIAGQTVTMLATVTALTGAPAGSVQFLDNSNLLQTVALNGGQATFSTSTLGAGSHSLTAVYSGNGIPAASQSQPITLTVSTSSTSVSLSSSRNPSRVGETVTFIATVRPTPDGGTVTFKDGTVTLGSGPVTNGVAQLTTSSLSFGQHSITAIFSGSAKAGGSTSLPFTQTVQGVTTTKLQISPGNAVFGQAVTFMATVTSPQGTPSGNVTFNSGGTTLGTVPLVNGLATFSPSTLAAGTYPITANYGGNGTYGPSADSGSLTVQKAPTNIVLSSSLNPSQTGQAVIFTATVSSNFSGTPSGPVTFLDGKTVLGTSVLSGGVAALNVPTLASGTHNITATYSGNSNFTGIASSVLIQQVNGGLLTPTVVLTIQPNPVKVGNPVSFTVKVSYPGGPEATGSVTISDATNGEKRYGVGILKNGVAVVRDTTIPVGSYNLVATYGGDGGVHYTGAQSSSVPLQVVVGQSNGK